MPIPIERQSQIARWYQWDSRRYQAQQEIALGTGTVIAGLVAGGVNDRPKVDYPPEPEPPKHGGQDEL